MIDANEIFIRLVADLRAAGIDPDKYLEKPEGKLPPSIWRVLKPLIDESYRCTECRAAFKTRDDAIKHIVKEHFKFRYNISYRAEQHGG